MADDAFAIQYSSVQDARDALRLDPSAEIESDNAWEDWTIVTVQQDEKVVVWTFPPPGSPAYPAAVKQVVIDTDAAFDIELRILCEAAAPACDQLEMEFNELNAKSIDSVRNSE